MDLLHKSARIVATRWRAPVGTSGLACGGPRAGRSRTSRRSSARTGGRPIARPISSSATRLRRRTSPRRPSSPRCAPRPLRPAQAVRPWLHRIVVNRAIDWARARSLRPEAEAGRCAGTRAARARRRAHARARPPVAGAPGGDRAPYLLEYTPGEIADCSSCRAGRSTRACAAGSTRSRSGCSEVPRAGEGARGRARLGGRARRLRAAEPVTWPRRHAGR
jgi:hypothetical protein